jgi:predicted GNAT family acetyltransferase
VSEPTITDVPGHSRYELRLDDQVVGHVEYRRHGDVVELVHTEVDDGHEGEGLGSQLAAGVLDDIRHRGLRVQPSCPFIASYIDRHPGDADLVVAPG